MFLIQVGTMMHYVHMDRSGMTPQQKRHIYTQSEIDAQRAFVNWNKLTKKQNKTKAKQKKEKKKMLSLCINIMNASWFSGAIQLCILIAFSKTYRVLLGALFIWSIPRSGIPMRGNWIPVRCID